MLQLALLLAFVHVASSQDRICPVVLPLPSRLSQRVVNGQLVQHDDLLFHAWLFTPLPVSFQFCSATRISKRWVLTAGHCGVTTEWNVSLSAAAFPDGLPARIESVHTHPKYTSLDKHPYDVALLRISPPPSEPPDVHFVRLNDAPSLPFESAFVRVSGYGVFGFNITALNSSRPIRPMVGDLHFADIPVHPFAPCNRLYTQLQLPEVPFLDAENEVCAGYAPNRCNICGGDSGGPFLQYDREGRAVQVAVTTASYGCVERRYPSIGVRVAALLPWFRQVGAEFETAEPEQVLERGGTDAVGGAPSGQAATPVADGTEPDGGEAGGSKPGIDVDDGDGDDDDDALVASDERTERRRNVTWVIVSVSATATLAAFVAAGCAVVYIKRRRTLQHVPLATLEPSAVTVGTFGSYS